MCGIFGYIGPQRSVSSMIMGGLKRLEYRGYDSAGVSVHTHECRYIRRSLGTLAHLEECIKQDPLPEGMVALGHTRWATHGRADDKRNIHPIVYSGVTLVHNGVVDNSESLRSLHPHAALSTDTDTESIALTFAHTQGTFEERLQKLCSMVQGSMAFALTCEEYPGVLALMTKGYAPLCLARCRDGGYIFASDAWALSPFSDEVHILEPHNVVILDQSQSSCDIRLWNFLSGEKQHLSWKPNVYVGMDDHAKRYPTFLEQEFRDQPSCLSHLCDKPCAPLAPIKGRLWVLGCGTSYHAALMAKIFMEERHKNGGAYDDMHIMYASEFVPSHHPLGPDDTMIVISQSGETLDILHACRYAKDQHCPLIAVTNMPQSSLARMADVVHVLDAGMEVSVASTKTFTSSLCILGNLMGLSMNNNDSMKDRLQTMIESTHSLDIWLDSMIQARGMFFLGRGFAGVLAMEAALKMKELSYIHAHGLYAGEMKHGSIALMDHTTPIIAAVYPGEFSTKMMSNIAEVRSRGCPVYAVVHKDCVDQLSDDMMYVTVDTPHSLWDYTLSLTFAYQYLALRMAERLGRSVDQPRHLAKSVTVE